MNPPGAVLLGLTAVTLAIALLFAASRRPARGPALGLAVLLWTPALGGVASVFASNLEGVIDHEGPNALLGVMALLVLASAAETAAVLVLLASAARVGPIDGAMS